MKFQSKSIQIQKKKVDNFLYVFMSECATTGTFSIFQLQSFPRMDSNSSIKTEQILS